MNIQSKLVHGSLSRLTRVACVLALVGLATMVYSILSPRPLPVIFAMSAGQMIGMLAVLCYLLAILVDVARGSAGGTSPQSLRPPNVARKKVVAAKKTEADSEPASDSESENDAESEADSEPESDSESESDPDSEDDEPASDPEPTKDR